jgi:hypothetical protein
MHEPTTTVTWRARHTRREYRALLEALPEAF